MSKTRFGLLLTAIVIFAMGLVMIFSTTSAEVLDLELERSTAQALQRQICYALIGLGLAYMVTRIGYRDLLQLSPILLTVLVLLLILVLIPGVGKEVNGSKRWISIAGLSFQPSEFVKYVLPAFFIRSYLSRQDDQISYRQFLRWVAIIFFPIFLIMIEPNNGTAGVICVTFIALFGLTRIPFKFWAIPLAAALVIGAVSASQLPYVAARVQVYLHPELDIKGKGHQPLQAKIAAGSGKFYGKGPGKSLQKLSYLPEAQNDYIAAIFAEEFGFLGISILVSLYMALAYLGFSIAYRCHDLAGFYLASVVTFLISFQAFMNLGVVSGLLPSTGLNLPLFSQGGSSLMANIAGIAILLDIQHSHKLRLA